MTLWRARDVYHARRGLKECVILFLLLEGLSFVGRGRWDLLLMILGFQVAVLWGGRWVLRQAGAWVRGRWHGLMVVLILTTLCSGCTDMVRAVAHLHGYKGDPYASTCAPESLQTGTCVTTKEGGK